MKKIHFIGFFLDEFHHGAVNHVLHFIGFTLLGFGLGSQNWLIVIFSPAVMESGHIYNYLTGRHKELAIKIIPLQLVAWIIFVGFVYLLTRALV